MKNLTLPCLCILTIIILASTTNGSFLKRIVKSEDKRSPNRDAHGHMTVRGGQKRSGAFVRRFLEAIGAASSSSTLGGGGGGGGMHEFNYGSSDEYDDYYDTSSRYDNSDEYYYYYDSQEYA